MTNKKLSDLSYNQKEFNKAKLLIRRSPVRKEFENIQYKTSRNRLRKVIWFNRPFNKNVESNIRKNF